MKLTEKKLVELGFQGEDPKSLKTMDFKGEDLQILEHTEHRRDNGDVLSGVFTHTNTKKTVLVVSEDKFMFFRFYKKEYLRIIALIDEETLELLAYVSRVWGKAPNEL